MTKVTVTATAPLPSVISWSNHNSPSPPSPLHL